MTNDNKQMAVIVTYEVESDAGSGVEVLVNGRVIADIYISGYSPEDNTVRRMGLARAVESLLNARVDVVTHKEDSR